MTLVAALAVAALLLPGVAAAEPGGAECGDLPPSTLRMSATEHDGLSVAPADMAEIDRLAAAHHIPDPMRHEPLVLMIPQLTSSFAVDERAIEVAPGVFCAAPASVELRMGITDYRVYIERSAFADACVRGELLDHARRHLAADNREVVAATERIREPLTAELTRLKGTPAGSRAEAIARLKSAVAGLLLQAVEGFGRQRVELHTAIDDPAQMAELGTACDGRMKSLESGARKPGRDT